MASSWGTRFPGCASAPETYTYCPRFSLVVAPSQVKGFPFSLGIKHPQYVGASLTVWALVALLWDPAGRPTLLPVGFGWTGLYVITAIIEDYF